MVRNPSNACPFCRCDESQTLFSRNDIPLLRCRDCGHRFCPSGTKGADRIASQFDDDYFFGGESCYEDYSAMGPDLQRKGAYYSKILKRNLSQTGLRNPKILDVGCAAGYLLEGFANQGWNTTGLEANQTMAKYGRFELGLDVHHSTIEDFRSQESYHAASLVQVLPHLTDPYKALNQIHDKLLPGGLLLIETWNCESLAAKALGRNWHEYNPPSVLHWFSKQSLSDQLEYCDFEIVEMGRPVKWINLGNAAAALKKSVSESRLLSALAAPTQLLPSWLKVPYPMDDCFWLVARKKAKVLAPVSVAASLGQEKAEMEIVRTVCADQSFGEDRRNYEW